MKVSILIPTMNRAMCLPTAIDSALAQDYPNLEVIVSDNASTDNTPDIIKRYNSDKRFKYYRNSENIGLVPNFNKLLVEHATGDYVLFLPDDDRLVDSTYIGRAVSCIEQNKNIIMVAAKCACRNVVTGQLISEENPNLKPGVIPGNLLWLNSHKVGFTIIAVLFSRNHALCVGGFFPDIAGIDALLLLRLYLNGDVYYLPDIVAEVGEHGNRHSYQAVEKNLDIAYENLDRVRLAAKYAVKKGISQADAAKWSHYHMVTGFLHILRTTCFPSGNPDSFMKLYQLAKGAGEEQFVFEAMINLLAVRAPQGAKE